MTLIVTCMTENHIVQVADRRLTDANGRLFDDEACKVTMLGSRGVVAFSGIAFLGAAPMSATDFWLTDALTDTLEPGAAARLLRDVASERFSRVPFTREGRRHAFVVAGWDSPDPDRASPVIYTVSNALKPDGGWLAKANDEFRIHCARKHRKEPEVRTAGARLGKNAKLLTTSAKEHRSERSVGALATSLARAVRTIAETEDTVGKGLLITVFPRAAIGQDHVFDARSPTAGEIEHGLDFDPARVTTIYVPADSQTTAYYFPNLVTVGMSMVGAVITEGPQDPDDVARAFADGQKRMHGL